MKKVLFFANPSTGDLQKELNDFCRRHNVTDIQYQITRRYVEPQQTLHCVMVVYEEDDNAT